MKSANPVVHARKPVRRRVVMSLAELVSAHNAGTFAYWEYNREVSENRARMIADHYAANGYDAGPMPLVIGELPGGAYLLDGQHRLRAGELLGREAAQVEISVVYEACANEAGLRKTFELINLGTPVPRRYYDDKLAAFVAATAALIKTRWRRAYSGAASASRPWFTDASLAYHLGGARCCQAITHRVLTPEAFVEELKSVCDDVEASYAANPDAAHRHYSTAHTPLVFPRAQEKGFCAGVMFEWGDHTAARLIAKME